MTGERIGHAMLYLGDCRDVLAGMPAESIDSCVTDPPYGLQFMDRKWDYDIPSVEVWTEVFRVLKPGAHLLAFGGTRTYHRLVCAIEDAGFEIRDQIGWCFGSGFPKSHDVAKGIDKQAGAVGTFGEPKSAEHARWIDSGRLRGKDCDPGWQRPWMDDPEAVSNAARQYIPATPEAAQWNGWGTALKPAWEPIVVARKPLAERTVAAQVLATGTGALNIEACRIGTTESTIRPFGKQEGTRKNGYGMRGGAEGGSDQGRWPANLIHDGSPEVEAAFAAFGERKSGGVTHQPKRSGFAGFRTGRDDGTHIYREADSGTASRFFYSAKASKVDRADSTTPHG